MLMTVLYVRCEFLFETSIFWLHNTVPGLEKSWRQTVISHMQSVVQMQVCVLSASCVLSVSFFGGVRQRLVLQHW